MYKIEFSKKIYVDKIPKYDLKRIVEKIKELVKDPRPRWTEKIKGTDLLRTTIGDYRVIGFKKFTEGRFYFQLLQTVAYGQLLLAAFFG